MASPMGGSAARLDRSPNSTTEKRSRKKIALTEISRSTDRAGSSALTKLRSSKVRPSLLEEGNVGSVYWSPVNFWPIDTVYFVPKEQADFWLYLALPSAGFQNTD